MRQSARRCGDRVRGHDGPHDPHGDGDHDLGHLRDCGRDLGHLHGDPISVIGASGCLTKHGDKMEITLISEHSYHNMLILDFDGNADIVENPFIKEGMSHRII